MIFKPMTPDRRTSATSAAAAMVAGTVLLMLAGCACPDRGLFPPKPGEKTETVWLVDHGIHTGVIAKTSTLPADVRPGWKTQPKGTRYEFTEFGWGDDGFYNAKHVTLGITLKALFWKNPAVLHVVAMDKPPERYFPYSGLVRITMSEEGYRRFCAFLEKSYATDAQGKHIEHGHGIYGESRFYRATGYYYFPNTCNVWTAHALRSAGAPMTLANSVLAQPVYDQACHFGTVIRKP